ncbi:MAG: hypothetical protein GY774_29140 [Planctomycetes bacterium]|nr:hypothetical protein [Planctomycetota bacterium]
MKVNSGGNEFRFNNKREMQSCHRDLKHRLAAEVETEFDYRCSDVDVWGSLRNSILDSLEQWRSH